MSGFESTAYLKFINCSMFSLAFVAGSLQGHWWGFSSRNYLVWSIFFLMNVFIALKGTHFFFFCFYFLFCSGFIAKRPPKRHLRRKHCPFISFTASERQGTKQNAITVISSGVHKQVNKPHSWWLGNSWWLFSDPSVIRITISYCRNEADLLTNKYW